MNRQLDSFTSDDLDLFISMISWNQFVQMIRQVIIFKYKPGLFYLNVKFDGSSLMVYPNRAVNTKLLILVDPGLYAKADSTHDCT